MSSIPDEQILKLWRMVLQRLQPREISSSLELYCNLVKYDVVNKIVEINVYKKTHN